ncbi:MAG TPA: DNA-processing protein DprA [Clostridia bacterium]|nr:DNA-processing protein DprA [Clostridia bacterium]
MTNISVTIQIMNEAGYIFSCIDFLSPNEKYRLYMASKSVYEIFDMNNDDLLYLSKISDVPYDKLKTVRNISYPKYKKGNSDIKITDIYSDDYPKMLKETYGAPIVLYHIGDIPKECMVSVVGSRKPGPYGIRCAEVLSVNLSLQGFTVVSGMAKGIDGICHMAALRHGNSVAVLGNGLNICYPSENRYIYDMLIKKGCLISEYPPDSKPGKINFPMRNRIISGLSFCTIVVEAGIKSGSLITANCALSQNREVYCFPNYIDTGFNGTNQLIKEGAGIITDIDDFCRELNAIEIHWKTIYYCKSN